MSASPAGRATVSRFAVPALGVGVGHRVPHYAHIRAERPAMDWFEVLSENLFVDGGSPLAHLRDLVARYPVVPHGVGANLGGPHDPTHTARLLQLLARVDPPWFSDHLCWTGTAEVRVHDLLPLPYTRATLQRVVDRIRALQDAAGRLFAIENVSSYVVWSDDEVPEWTFLAEVAERADCALLLDLNNVVVSASNHGFDPMDFLTAVPMDRVVQIHLAGHLVQPDGLRIDTHDRPVGEAAWALYRAAIAAVGPVSTLIEWDADLPPFARLAEEAATARRVRDAVLGV